MLHRLGSLTPLRLFTSSLHISRLPVCYRAMSTSPFQLDPKIFNATLYKHVTDVWLPGIDTNGQSLDVNVEKRWFGGTADEKRAFDTECRSAFAHALESVGPENFPGASAGPFVEEIARVAAEEGADSDQAAWTALSLTLLLDQMPRNIYRTEDGLRKVYGHYDRMSYSLSRALLSGTTIPRPDTSLLFRRSGAHRCWFYIPLMHSESLAAHDQLSAIMASYSEELAGVEGYEASKAFLNNQIHAEKEHRDILDRFGRYPHRNEALGREGTEEERAFLEGGGATFGVGQKKDTEA